MTYFYTPDRVEQLLWRSSKQLGVGVVKYFNGRGIVFLTVFHYFPARDDNHENNIFPIGLDCDEHEAISKIENSITETDNQDQLEAIISTWESTRGITNKDDPDTGGCTDELKDEDADADKAFVISKTHLKEGDERSCQEIQIVNNYHHQIK